MNQKDKNILIVVIFIIIFLLAWTLTNYNSTKKESKQKEVLQLQLDAKEKKTKESSSEQKSTNLVPTISITELNKRLLTDDAIVIIDTRSIEAFNAGHMKNSLHISEFDTSRQHRTIIFVTENGDESEIIQYYRATSDTNKVYNLTGGFAAWKKSGGNVITLDIKRTFENQAKVHFIEPRDLNKLLMNNENDKLVIIDTRRTGNYQKGHIKNAINIPFIEIERRYKEIPTAKKIYAYGADEEMSFDAGVLLYDLGFIGIKAVNGGFAAWKQYGYPITK